MPQNFPPPAAAVQDGVPVDMDRRERRHDHQQLRESCPRGIRDGLFSPTVSRPAGHVSTKLQLWQARVVVVVVLWLSEFLFIDFVARSMCDLIRGSFEVEEVIIAGGKVLVPSSLTLCGQKYYLELSNNRTTFQRIDRVRVLEKINAGD